MSNLLGCKEYTHSVFSLLDRCCTYSIHFPPVQTVDFPTGKTGQGQPPPPGKMGLVQSPPPPQEELPRVPISPMGNYLYYRIFAHMIIRFHSPFLFINFDYIKMLCPVLVIQLFYFICTSVLYILKFMRDLEYQNHHSTFKQKRKFKS